MSKALIKLANYLYRKYGNIDIIAMTHEQLNLIAPPINFNLLSPEEQLSFCKECKAILDSKHFQTVYGLVLEGYKESLFRSPVTSHRDIQMRIDGLDTFMKAIQEFANRKEPVKEEFDPYDIL